MFRNLKTFMASLILMILGANCLPVRYLATETHVVNTSELHKTMIASSETRQQNLSKVQKFFSSKEARQALQNSKLNGSKVEKAIPLLSDEELARLASQTDKIQNDLAAGALSNQEITYIIIALATAVIILIIVAA